MLYLTSDMNSVSVSERVNIMNYHLNKVGIPIDYDRLIEYYIDAKVDVQLLSDKLFKSLGSCMSGTLFNKRWIVDWINKNGFKIGFNSTPSGSLSLSSDSINSFIETNYYGDEVSNVMKLYMEFNAASKRVDFIPNILKVYKPTGLESEYGRRITIIKPNVAIQNTGRFGYTNPGVQNFPRFMKDLYVAPKGWTLLTADSGQIEPKLTFGFYIRDKQIQTLINLYKDAYYGILHYCLMPEEDIRSLRTDFEKREITEEMKDLRQRLKTLGNGVMYGSTSNKNKDPLKDAYIKRIGMHPMRLELVNRLEYEINYGKRIFNTLFGTPIDIYKSEKYLNAKTPELKKLALIHCAINNPIQGTAGDLMGFSLKASHELMMKKAPYSWIVKFIHDEGQYCIHNSELDYVLEELSGHTSYSIDGIVEIYNDPKLHRKLSNVVCSYNKLMGVDYIVL